MKKQEKLKDFRRMKKDELLSLLTERQEFLRGLRLDLVAGKTKNIKEIKETKKDIARILTILNPKNQNLKAQQ